MKANRVIQANARLKRVAGTPDFQAVVEPVCDEHRQILTAANDDAVAMTPETTDGERLVTRSLA